MNCLRECSYVVPARGTEAQYENPIFYHWQVSQHGYNYYFCATHRTYHCMFIDGNLDQPYCGECAPFYYQGFPNIVWEKALDRPTVRPAAHHSNLTTLANELTNMNRAIQTHRNVHGRHFQAPANPFVVPSANDSTNEGIDVPRGDPTYQGLGTVLVGHPRQRGLFRLCFHSYAGALGWMPCGPDIGQRAEFLNLAQHEEHGDRLFKRARLWACKVQGHLYLHKDIRWVLWNIYMLSSEVLYNSQETNENVFWGMREWLHNLYVTALKLFNYHQVEIPIPMPEHDWLARPTGRFNPPVAEVEQEALGGQPNTPTESDTGSDNNLLNYADFSIADDFSSGEDTPDEGDSELDF